jgi:hypothetical protein
MKILLVHPDDSVEVGEWARTRWDLVVDLGWSGRHAYVQQSERIGSRVVNLQDVLDHDEHRCRLRELLALVLDQVVDSESVDWWDAFSAFVYPQLEELMLLSALAEQITSDAEIFATRAHPALPALSLLLNSSREFKSFSPKSNGDFDPRTQRSLFRSTVLRSRVKAALALRPSQLIEIALDKWDADYSLRRRLVRSSRPSSTSVVLLPSSYLNVSRVQVAYARMLPYRRFLLVATRRSGRLQDLPPNVELRSLASYAPGLLPSTREEYVQLLARWQTMQNNFSAATLSKTARLLRLANELHLFDGFANFLRNGLRIRDAWREVFAREPVASVLSADENNPYTRLPIVLAKSRNLHTTFCDHGALNMIFGIRRPVSDTYLMKGDMARDYAVGWCGLPADKVVVGAPSDPHSPPSPRQSHERDWIVYYSEAYELFSGRVEAFYAELLPELCLLARQTNRKIIVKLHPFESRRTRKAIINRVLPPEQRKLVQIREGVMTPDLFARAWFSLTVESSVAVESTLHGVPCFLCSWFDASWYGYGKQFAKYSAGYPLDSPQRIREIPQLLEKIRITEATRSGLQTSITPEQLESVLSGT